MISDIRKQSIINDIRKKMIILSSSLPKSASTIFATYIEDIVAESGRRNGQGTLKKLVGGRYVDKISPGLAVRLLPAAYLQGDMVLKSHCAPNRTVRWMICARQLKALYIFRDPRDVVLSAMDHRKRLGISSDSAFGKFTDLASGCDGVIGWAKVWREWKDFGRAGFFRYEDLMTDPFVVLQKVCRYLDIEINDYAIKDIIARHDKNKHHSHNFNKGTVCRYKRECSAESRDLLEKSLGGLAREMGYD